MTRQPEITRAVPLIDYEVDHAGDGRTVIAYAATFGNQYEVKDQWGHYDEMVNRAAFNKVLARPGAIDRIHVFYNHGMTLYGTPSDRWSEPLGVPLEVKPDGRGLLTRTRYGKSEAAEAVLQMWKDGLVRAQSFTGARGPTVTRSQQGPNGRPVIELMQLGIKEYGPSPLSLNVSADLVAIRSSLLERPVTQLSLDERRELAILLSQEETEEVDPQVDPAKAPVETPPAEVHDAGLSLELIEAEQAQRRRR